MDNNSTKPKTRFTTCLALRFLLPFFPQEQQSKEQGYRVFSAPRIDGKSLLLKFPDGMATIDPNDAAEMKAIFWVTKMTEQHPYNKFQFNWGDNPDVFSHHLWVNEEESAWAFSLGNKNIGVFRIYKDSVAYTDKNLETIQAVCHNHNPDISFDKLF